MELVAISRTTIEGAAAVIAGLVLFGGTVWLLLSAIFGVRMGYLVAATGMFAFMIVLSAIWAFGAPGTPAFLGPKGQLPHWVAVGAGLDIRSSTYPTVDRYPGEPWREPGPALAEEVEPATLALQELLAEEATQELRDAGLQGEIEPTQFEVTDLRFVTVDGTELAAGAAVSETGGPRVEAFAFKDQGNEPLPSYLFLAGSVIGFAAHLPFLDRAERRRKEIITGGEQSPWRGPA